MDRGDVRVLGFVIALFLAALIGPVYYLGNAYVASLKITAQQLPYQLAFFLVPLGLYALVKTRPGLVKWLTYPVIGLWFPFFLVYGPVSTFYSSGIADTSLINVQVTSGTWHESYTRWREDRQCTGGTDDKGNCRSYTTFRYCDDHVSDSFEIGFSDGSEHSIRSGNYSSLKRSFKNERQEPESHFDQCSTGDGRKFVTRYAQGQSEELYGSYEIPVVNYVIATRNVLTNSEAVAAPYLKLIADVPGLVEHPAGIGPWKSDRVLAVGTKAPSDWIRMADSALNKLNGAFGPTKQWNVVLYVVGTKDRGFAEGLDAKWKHGKKNQLTVIVGSETFPNVDWVEAMSFWSKDTDVKFELESRLSALKLDDPQFLPTLSDAAMKHWDRKPMSSLEYLTKNIDVPFWALLLAVLASFALSSAFVFLFAIALGSTL